MYRDHRELSLPSSFPSNIVNMLTAHHTDKMVPGRFDLHGLHLDDVVSSLGYVFAASVALVWNKVGYRSVPD